MNRQNEKENPKPDEEHREPRRVTKEDYETMIRRSRELIKRVDSYLSRETREDDR